MFKAIHNDPKQLHAIFDSFSGLITDFNIRIRKDGLYINELDSSHVCMIMLELNEDEFSVFEYTEDIQLGIHLKNLVSLLKVGRNAESIELYVNDEDTLDISFSTSYDKKEYSLKLMDLDTAELEPNSMDYYCEFDISPNIYNDIIDSACVTGTDVLKSRIHNGKLQFISDGDMGNLTQSFDRGENIDKKKLVIKSKSGESKKIPHPKSNSYTLHSCSGEFESEFSIRNLELFKKATGLVDKVSINISPSVPLRIDLMINDNTGSIINFYLAPKITET